MNILLSLLKIHTPVTLKKRKIRELFEITGKAFQCDIPPLNGLGYEDLLKEYAMFAKAQCEKSVRESKNIEEIKAKLYQDALETGNKLGNTLNLKGMKDIMYASKLFYSILGISFSGNERGEIAIGQCYFSKYFSPEVCRIISSLDEGVAEGLSQGKKLCFNQRITEGRNCCKAVLK